MASNLKLSKSLALGLAAAAFALCLTSRLKAEDGGGGNDTPSLSDATGDGLAKLDPLIKAQFLGAHRFRDTKTGRERWPVGDMQSEHLAKLFAPL